MFHEGDLQDGISEAIQQQKLVACFVRKGMISSPDDCVSRRCNIVTIEI
jgi:hypothetical protein